jgi:hypothetical protein
MRRFASQFSHVLAARIVQAAGANSLRAAVFQSAGCNPDVLTVAPVDTGIDDGSSGAPGASQGARRQIGCPCDRAGAVGRANAGRTLWLGNLFDVYRSDSTCSGTRVRFADGDGIGDLDELYRNQILNGLYTVDTDNIGIDDRNPVVGP